MITPGCSYTFDGMKQTMLAVNSQVKMQKVRHLTRNYRMSKDVLDVGNAILGLLKTRYPHAIEYAPPEIAMKDLGFRVVLLDFGKAKQYTNETAEVQAKKKLSFGTKQAVVSHCGCGQLTQSFCKTSPNDSFLSIDHCKPT